MYHLQCAITGHQAHESEDTVPVPGQHHIKFTHIEDRRDLVNSILSTRSGRSRRLESTVARWSLLNSVVRYNVVAW
jgi:hypothetical protein